MARLGAAHYERKKEQGHQWPCPRWLACVRGAIFRFKLWGEIGGREGARTPDLLVANEALSQLSYTPSDLTG